jgi:ADP-ribose pyrophosphatase YjhB (NUDIX family)
MIGLTVECFVEKDGKYLMLKRGPTKKILPNVWIAPGGHQEFCEGVIAATKREIREETGLEIEKVELKVTGIAHLKDINTEFCFHILTASYKGGELIQEPGVGELVWLEANEIAKLDNVLAELKPIIPLILNKNNSNKVLSVRAVYERGNELSEFEIENPD